MRRITQLERELRNLRNDVDAARKEAQDARDDVAAARKTIDFRGAYALAGKDLIDETRREIDRLLPGATDPERANAALKVAGDVAQSLAQKKGWEDPDLVLDQWYKYEEIAMHFNDLLMRFRTQALGGGSPP